MNAAFSYRPNVAAEVMTITPALAQRWLDATPGNRRERAKRVEQWARDMRAGRWRLNGEAIILDRDGRLLDGHHRCRAIVLSGVAVQCLVVQNVDRESAAYTIDTGIGRDAVDALAFSNSDIKKLGIPLTRIKAIANFCILIALRYNQKTPTTADDLEAWFRVYGGSLAEVWPYIGKAPTTRAEVAATLVALHRYNKTRIVTSDVLQFCADMSSGANLNADDPVYRTREKLQNKKARGFREQATAASTVVRAFEARRRGKIWSRNAPSGEDPAADVAAILDPVWVREIRAVRGRDKEVRSAHSRPAR